MAMSAQEWYRSYGYKRLVQDRASEDHQRSRMNRTKTGRRSWTNCGGSVDHAISRETGGCFLAAESGNRDEKGIMASSAYMPEVADEDARINRNDRLRRFVSVVVDPRTDFQIQESDESDEE